MKNIFKITVLIFAIAVVAGSCKKESDDSIIGTWVSEKIEVKDLTFASGIDPFIRAAFRTYLEEAMKEASTEIAGASFEFLKNGTVIAIGIVHEGSTEGTYDIVGKNLTITLEGMPLTGTHSVSKHNLHWDLSMQEMFGEAMGLELMELITDATFRWTFTRK